MQGKYPYSILFVEDEKAIRENYVLYLDMFFDEVYQAEDAELAYEIYKQKKPNILIVDIHLPKLSGIDLLKKIRETDHATKSIILTAHADTNFLLEAASLKLTKYLIKPVSKDDLQDAIDLVLKELSSFDTLALKQIVLKEGYSWFYETQKLMCENEIIKLTKKEKILFSFLASDVNKVFSYEDIIYELWPTPDDGNIDALKTMIKNLRKKLPKDTVQNIFGVGYKIEI